jgi:hypothetical protein
MKEYTHHSIKYTTNTIKSIPQPTIIHDRTPYKTTQQDILT